MFRIIIKNLPHALINLTKTLLIFLTLWVHSAFAETDLADRPVFSGNVSGNVALALSVEWPTGVISAYKNQYQLSKQYLGHHDPDKCYSYHLGDKLTGLLFNTGVNSSGTPLGYNNQDPHWTLVSSPYVPNFQKVMLDNTSLSYASATAKSLGMHAGGVSAGDYHYESNQFTIPNNIDPANVSVTFDLLTDDALVDIKVNNTLLGITASSNWYSFDTVTIPAGSFQSAQNTITIIIHNNLGATGLMIDNLKMVGGNGEYFEPQGSATNHTCNAVSAGRWSGNYLNWALTAAIDPFRVALTGGYRAVDKVGLSVLEKAYGEERGTYYTPNKTLNNATLIAQSTPYSGLSKLVIRSHGLGNKFYISSTGDVENPNNSGGLRDADELLSNPNGARVYALYARNQVCKNGYLETNCTLYPDGDYKPTGEIQNNAAKLKYAAFGYLNDNNIKRDGAVLRARMAYLGYKGTNPEWDTDTGIFYANPNAADATASGVSKSGVINYLNQFGLTAPGYKSYDPVSELYYTAGRYFRNKSNVTSYTNNPNTTMKDGFPIITDWKDPIKYSCEANFIIGIGDSNGWADANLPGSTIRSGSEPSLPSEVSIDFGSLTDTAIHYTDAKKSTDFVGKLAGLGNLGQKYVTWGGSGRKNTYFMAGLAYDLHTRDFRPDISGEQTITTYWLDTLESGDYRSHGFSQFWLTAKYGGFDVPENYDPYDPVNTDPATADWDANNDGDPDNYFRANKPKLMIDGLKSAFANIIASVEQSTTGFALSSPNITQGDLSFGAAYDSKKWVGSVSAKTISFDANGNPDTNTAPIWTTDTSLEIQAAGSGWSTKRVIATSKCVASGTSGEQNCTGIPFRFNQLDSSQKTAVNTVGTITNIGEDVINFIRGDKSNEGVLRTRTKLLGDIVNAQLLAIGSPNAPYSNTKNPGYSTFKATYQNRPTVVYAGANDGMLHAFDGASGNELFAYVPNALFAGPDSTPNDNGLAALAKSAYLHRYYVDSTPVIFDVNFGSSDADWHSLLIGGLGKGGKSYYALDVTDPAALTSEAALASAVKWEFTHEDLGYSYGRPLVVKTNTGKWVVILTSGYNNQDGKGYFFVLDAKNGALLHKISTGAGNASSDAGLAHVTAFVADSSSFEADAAYAGDLLGNVWRLNLKGIGESGYSRSPKKIAKLTAPNGTAQPITTSPVVEYDASTSRRLVFIGTGSLLGENDITDMQKQSFYAILDGTANGFYTNATLPSAAGGFPITPRSVMIDHTDKADAVTTDLNKPMGYYIDLDTGFRIYVPMDSAAGTIAFAANKLSGDECNVSTLFRGYALQYGNGKSLLTNLGTGLATQYIEVQGVTSNISIYKKPNSPNISVNFSYSDENNASQNKSIDTQSAGTQYQLLNWRAIPNQN